jgi:hypothetical protein
VERDHLEDRDVDERIILNLILGLWIFLKFCTGLTAYGADEPLSYAAAPRSERAVVYVPLACTLQQASRA